MDEGCFEPRLRGGGGERCGGRLETLETARGAEIDRNENRAKKIFRVEISPLCPGCETPDMRETPEKSRVFGVLALPRGKRKWLEPP